MRGFLMNTLQFQGTDLDRVCRFVRSDHSQLDFDKILPVPMACRDRPAWIRKHWGTRWGGAIRVERIASNVYSFRTYGSAVPVMEALARRFPDVRFRHQWSEELPGWNAGVIVYEDGREVRRSESERVDELPWFEEEYLESLAMDETSEGLVAVAQ